VILIAILLGFLVNLASGLISHYIIAGYLHIHYLALTIISIALLIMWLIFSYIPQQLSEIFSLKIFYNEETGDVRFFPLLIIPPYQPAIEAEICCRELFETSPNERNFIKEGKLDSKIFTDLAEVLALSWLSQTAMLRTTPLGEVIRRPILLLKVPIRRIENEELCKIFADNIFFKGKCPSIVSGLVIPKGFSLMPKKENEVKGLLVSSKIDDVTMYTRYVGGRGPAGGITIISKTHLTPIVNLSIKFYVDSIANAATTLLYLLGYTPLIVSAEEIICTGKVIKDNELKELQKWRELRYVGLIEVKFRPLISLFHPRFSSYYRWVIGLFDDAKSHFDFPLYIENLRKMR
jgi:hypothetical protein